MEVDDDIALIQPPLWVCHKYDVLSAVAWHLRYFRSHNKPENFTASMAIVNRDATKERDDGD